MSGQQQNPLPQMIARALHAALTSIFSNYPFRNLMDTNVRSHRRARSLAHRNPLLHHGEKYYSQNDEDGILLEICRRLGLSRGHFIEVGVGDGTENNSLILLMSGWRGAWLGNEDLAFAIPAATKRLVYEKVHVTKENVHSLYLQSARRLDIGSYDLLSIDVDGNERHLLESLLDQGIRPAVLIVEYNGKFPPPIQFCIDYDPAFTWDGSDYCGASLQSLADLLGPAGYRLVACNATGVNAFFVDCRFADRFQDVPTEIETLFMPAEYSLYEAGNHPTSGRTVLSFLKD